MRFGHFRLERYGPFEALDLPFDPTPGRINLIVAPNGYGKSIIRHAFHEFLFDIEARTPMSFRFGTEKMFLRADIVQDGTTRSLIRRKGNGNTLALAGGAEFSEAETKRLLDGATKTVFRELFGLDTALLRSGGRDLIRSQGSLGKVLFAAAGGMGRVRDLLSDLERRRDELGKATARHRSRPLWNALSNWEQGAADLRQAALRPDGWAALERDALTAAEALQALLTEQADEARERDSLRTIGACRPWLARLHVARQTLADGADAPELDSTFEKRWRDALENRVKSASGAEAARNELRTAQDARTALTFDPAWIAAEADIAALADLRGQALGAGTDLPRVQRDHAGYAEKAAALRRDLGWSDMFALPPAPAVKDAQKRLQQYPKLAQAAGTARESLDEAERRLAATLEDLESLPAADDIAAVADLAALIRAGGDPTGRLDTARRKLLDADAAFRTALSAIPDTALTETSLGATASPSEARLDAAANALSNAETAHAAAARDHAAHTAAIETERTKLAALERSAMLPPADALATARAHRDTIWARLFTPNPAPPDPATAIAMDRAIRDADAVADALIAHGQDVAEAAAIRANLATMQAALTNHRDAMTQAAAALTTARGDVRTIARAAGGDTGEIAPLRAFLRARQAAVACRDIRDAAAADRADVENTLVVLAVRLATALNLPMPDLGATGTILAVADRRISAGQALANRRAHLTELAAERRTARTAAAAAAVKAEQAQAAWQDQWRPVAASLAHADTETEAATDALSRIEELRRTEHEAAGAQRRIGDMQAAIALLAARIAHLATLSPDLAALPPAEAAHAFQVRLQTEQTQAALCAGADRRIEQATQNLTAAAAAEDAANRTLDGLRAALLAASDDEAERQLQRVRTVTAARSDSAEAQRHLAGQGAGLSLDALTERAAGTTPEADAARLAAIAAAHDERLIRIDAARDASTAAAAALEQAGTGMNAAEAAQRREAAQANLGRIAEEALLLHATHALLQAAMDRQAAGASQPLLDRIGAVFRTITGGAQAGVRIEDSKDGQTMVALDADGVGRKSLDQLSEGTCDQLYLALRIAALEDHAANTAPLPFIADDILQTFDDPRTTATMRALLELSAQVQVIVLTHHPHVGDLAARLPDGAVKVMRLEA